ncbi:MAG: glycosyltransferase family 4 protein [Bdellovibrionales bacterium]|nr:glycosyltransferase family 4 protein [Bdellovibrionales bacterium]
MRVLHIGNESSWRGGENQIRLLIRGLNSVGVENYVAYPAGTPGYERLKLLAHRAMALPSKNPLNLNSILHLVMFCRNNKIDLIDAHSSGGHSLAIWVRRFAPQLKLVVHRRVDNRIKRNFFSGRKYRNQLVDEYIAVSECIRNILVDYGVREEKIHVIRDGVDPSPYEKIEKKKARQSLLNALKMESESDIFLIGNASALTHQKGTDTLLRAVKHLKEEGLLFHCVIAGDGALRNQLEEMAQELGVDDRVTFLGFIDYVPEFLSGLDLLVMPSNNEGLGSLLLEGLLAGCFVVATSVGGIPEIIRDSDLGLLSPKGDAQALARNIMRANSRRQSISSGRSYVVENFDCRKMALETHSIYLNLLGSRV